MGIIAGNREAVAGYAMSQLGDSFDATAMDEVFAHADAVVASERYADWDESVLTRVLGAEAGEAIELLADIKHKVSRLFVNKFRARQSTRPPYTVLLVKIRLCLMIHMPTA